MILVNLRYLNADHIQHIYVEEYSREQDRYVVIVHLLGNVAVFGRSDNDYMTLPMAFELRNRIVKAIVDYKSNKKPTIQFVEIPQFDEFHPEGDPDRENKNDTDKSRKPLPL